jgi:hypothetical protein
VYILLGQSNMVGEGSIEGTSDGDLEHAVKSEGLYSYLWDAATNDWAVRRDVRLLEVMGSGNPGFNRSKLQHNEWMGVNGTVKDSIGPELGIGAVMGNFTSNFSSASASGSGPAGPAGGHGHTMILKSCIGGRSLGWDLLPPDSPSHEYTDPADNQTYTYAGYHQSPNRWLKGTTPKRNGWEAGLQYDGDTANAEYVLANFETFYPGVTKYEVKGFFWWQVRLRCVGWLRWWLWRGSCWVNRVS